MDQFAFISYQEMRCLPICSIVAEKQYQELGGMGYLSLVRSSH